MDKLDTPMILLRHWLTILFVLLTATVFATAAESKVFLQSNRTFAYDTLGRMTAVTNALGYVTSYAYDELGQQLSQTDANQHTTTFEYDSLGRRVKRTLPGNQVETYAYNIGGLLTNKTDFNGYVTAYQYDLMNRLLAKIPDARSQTPVPITYGYNVLGLRTNMTDASGATAYVYDGRNRLAQKTKMWWNTAAPAVQFSAALNYSYDANGSVTNIVSSSVNGVNVGYEYDALNRLSAVQDANVGRTAYTYDDVGSLKGYTYPNFVHTEHTYDALNRLTNLASGTLLTPLANYAYTVGASGNRLTATETVSPNGVPRTINRLYTYDDVYRLTGETISGAPNSGSASYGYDPVGNRQSRSVLTLPLTPQSFSFDANDRLSTDSYDANGNTLLGAGFNQFQPDQYDFENRLVSRVATVNGQATTINLCYDGDGNRVKKTVVTPTNSVTTFFVVDDLNPSGYAQVLEELTSNSQLPTPAVTRVYTYGHTLISQDRLDGALWTTSFYGYDGHNNVRYLTDLNGNVTDTYDYDAFGNVIAATGNTPNLYLFTGEQFDLDLGLYYLRARYHNPNTGRFWTEDSYEGNGSDPASLHKYTYCGNNPVNSFDPSGDFSLVELGHVGVIGGLTTAWTGAIFRALGAASASAGLQGSLDAANNGIGGDFTSGFAGGILGYGVGKAAFFAIGRAAPYLLGNSPARAMTVFDNISARLNSISQSTEASFSEWVATQEALTEEAAVVTAPFEGSAALVPKATQSLGKWGEARLFQVLDGAGIKPRGAFMTSDGPRFIDRLVNGVAHEAKAGVNVGLNSTIERQVLKDAELIRTAQINDCVWHFFQGAQRELLDFLNQNGIKYILH